MTTTDLAVVFGKTTKLTKVDRYGWVIKDTPGKLTVLSKNLLNVNRDYQREFSSKQKSKEIASSWSWLACAAIVVAERNGEYWVVDGEHRVIAAMSRSDIDLLPCVVFHTDSAQQEARGFLQLNTLRKPVSVFDKHRAALVAGDRAATELQRVVDEFGITLNRNGATPRTSKCINMLTNMVSESEPHLRATLGIIMGIPGDFSVGEKLLSGISYLLRNIEGGMTAKLETRIRNVGAERLIAGASRAATFYVRGGAKVFAIGMLEELNKNLQHKYTLKESK